MLVLLPTSCQENLEQEATGYVSLSFDLDKTDEPVFTKAAGEPVLALEIRNARGEVVKSWPDMRDIAETPVELYAGSYKAIAYSSVESAAFDAPAYRGETSFRIVPHQNTDIKLTCTLSNVKVTAAFDKSITEKFSEYVLTVSNGESELVFSNLDGTLAKEGFFAVTGTLSWKLHLKNNNGRVYEDLQDTYTDVKARQHYNLAFSLGKVDPFGGGAFEIVLDNSYNEKVYDVILDFDAKNHPTITSDAFEFALQNELIQGFKVDGRIFFRFADGLKSVRIRHESAELEQLGFARVNEFIGTSPEQIAAYANLGIAVEAYSAGAPEVLVDMSSFLTKVPKGEYKIFLEATNVNDKVKIETFALRVLPGSSAELVDVTPWARYATFVGQWFTPEMPAGLNFQYKQADAAEWSTFEPSALKIDAQSQTVRAAIYGLELGTAYEVRIVTEAEPEGPVKSFTTDAVAGTLTNMNMDSWSKVGKHIYPNADNSIDHTWDSANEGSNTLKEVNPTRSDANVVAVSGPGKSAARMESVAVMGNFAAGSIFTGDFGAATLSPLGATLQWGVPFESRPYAMKGYYNYSPKAITHATGAYSSLKGKTDEMIIQVFLTDWDKPFDINTGAGRFVDVQNDPAIIAFGMVTCGEDTNGYVEFTIPLEYRDTKRKPKYIVISAAASRYGDYFTGAVGSVLYLDEMSFVYDPTELGAMNQ